MFDASSHCAKNESKTSTATSFWWFEARCFCITFGSSRLCRPCLYRVCGLTWAVDQPCWNCWRMGRTCVYTCGVCCHGNQVCVKVNTWGGKQQQDDRQVRGRPTDRCEADRRTDKRTCLQRLCEAVYRLCVEDDGRRLCNVTSSCDRKRGQTKCWRWNKLVITTSLTCDIMAQSKTWCWNQSEHRVSFLSAISLLIYRIESFCLSPVRSMWRLVTDSAPPADITSIHTYVNLVGGSLVTWFYFHTLWIYSIDLYWSAQWSGSSTCDISLELSLKLVDGDQLICHCKQTTDTPTGSKFMCWTLPPLTSSRWW